MAQQGKYTKNQILINAVRCGKLEVVKQFLASNPVSRANGLDYFLLINALKGGHKEVAKLLLMKGARVNCRLKKYIELRPPLLVAIPLGDLEIVKLIIEKGSAINYKDFNGGVSPLHLAVVHKQTSITEYLLHCGAFVDIKDTLDNTPLHAAANTGDKYIVKALVAFNADVNSKNCSGDTPLSLAMSSYSIVSSDYIDMIELLVGFGADVNTRDCLGNTALHIAVMAKNKNMVMTLAALNADLNSKTNFGYSPLCKAIQCNNIDMIELLLGLGVDVNSRDYFGDTPLHKVARSGEKEIFKILLAKGANNWSLANKKGETPFFLALKSETTNIAKLILNTFEIDVNSIDETNTTPLHYAALSSDFELVEMLLARGAKVDPVNNLGDTPFRIAAEFNNHFKIVELLYSKGARVNSRDKNGVTPLHVASYTRNLELVNKLLSFGASLNSKVDFTDDDYLIRGKEEHISGFTPLHWAIRGGSLEIVNVLLNAGADISIRDKKRQTPVHIACLEGNTEIMNAFLEGGVDINSTDEDGMTPLHLACTSNDLKSANFFLSKGANTEVICKDSNFPIHIATKNRNAEMVQLLLKNDARIDAKCGGHTALHIVSKLGCTATAEAILKFHPNLDAVNKQGNTALHLASGLGKVEMIELLLKYGCNINAINYNGRTPVDVSLDLLEQRKPPNFDRSDIERFYNYFIDYSISIQREVRLQNQIDKIFDKHFLKLHVAEIPINKVNLPYLWTNHYCREAQKLEDEYRLEIIKMKKENIKDTSISLYKFLTNDINQLAIYVKNATLVENLESQYYKASFPIYCDMILANIGKAKKRRVLSDKSLEFFNYLNDITLPITCALEIISYLSNNDLENMV